MQTKDRAQLVSNNDDADPMIDEGYFRTYGGYKPHFKGTTPGYFPLEGIDFVYIMIFTLCTWAIMIPPWYGMLHAGLSDSKQFSTVCGCVFVGFFLSMIIAMYFVGRLKRSMEKKMIGLKLKELEEQQLKENKEKQDQ